MNATGIRIRISQSEPLFNVPPSLLYSTRVRIIGDFILHKSAYYTRIITMIICMQLICVILLLIKFLNDYNLFSFWKQKDIISSPDDFIGVLFFCYKTRRIVTSVMFLFFVSTINRIQNRVSSLQQMIMHAK